MRKVQSALRHHLDQIAEAELVAQVPAHAQNDHLAVEMPSPKQLLDAIQFAHRWSPTLQDQCTRRTRTICTRAVSLRWVEVPARRIGTQRPCSSFELFPGCERECVSQ